MRVEQVLCYAAEDREAVTAGNLLVVLQLKTAFALNLLEVLSELVER